MRDAETTIGNLADKQPVAFIGVADEEGFPIVKAMLASFWGSIFPVSLIPLYMRFWTVPARDSSHNSRKAEEEQYLLTFKMSRSILVPTMKRGAGVESG